VNDQAPIAENVAGRERVAKALYDYLLGKHKPREWPAPEQHMPWWLGLADTAILAGREAQQQDRPWPFGAESACRLIAATGNPNERKENRDAWAVTMLSRPDVLAIEVDRARTRLEQAIARVTPPDRGDKS
jgi:hypothetical protein